MQIGRRKTLLHSMFACLAFAAFMQVFVARQVAARSVQADYRAFFTAGYLLRTAPTHLYSFAAQRALQNALISPARFSLPYYHLPYEAVLFVPFSWLPYWASYRCFLLFNTLLLLPTLLALPAAATRRLPLLRRLPALLLFLCVPVVIALVQGQDSILFLLLCTVAWRAWSGKRDGVCGCLLGLALFRFQLVLPLVTLLWLHRRSRGLALGFLGTASALMAFSYALAGATGFHALLSLLSSSSLSQDHGNALQNTMGVHPLATPNLYGLLYGLGLHRVSAGHATAMAAVASLALFLFVAFRMRTMRHANAAFALALLCSLSVSYHLSMHDLSALPLALTLLRTRAALLVGLATYVLSIALLFAGANLIYLLAIPVLLLVLLPVKRLRSTSLRQTWHAEPAHSSSSMAS